MAITFSVTQVTYNFTASIVKSSFTVSNQNTVLTIQPAPVVTVQATNNISTAQVVTSGVISVLTPSTATVYTTSGNGISTIFQLTPAPLNQDYLEVVVGGVVQVAGNSYTVGDVNTATVTVTFSEAPPAGTNNITFRYYSILVAETIMGPRGYTGPTGPGSTVSGPQGPRGLTGPPGPAGTPGGPSGPQGVSGPSGPMGLTGNQGPRGPTGPQGPSGVQGPQGPSGASGPQGAPGPNTYYIDSGNNVVLVGNNITGPLSGQGAKAIAIGFQAGQINQKSGGVAIGWNAGQSGQQYQAVAVGQEAGQTNQGQDATAVGFLAGYQNQGLGATAVGSGAGYINQGRCAVAIGNGAGDNSQAANSIVIHAGPGGLTAYTQGFFVYPIRTVVSDNGLLPLYYNTLTNEIVQWQG